jgi:hypothetical protein
MADIRAVVSGLHRQSDFELSGSLKGKQGDLGHSFIRRCLRHQIPRVDQFHTCRCKIDYVARYDLHPVNQRDCRDHRVTVSPWVGYMQARAAACRCGVKRQYLAFERLEDLAFEPLAQ